MEYARNFAEVILLVLDAESTDQEYEFQAKHEQ
jgi:hypothetical protein